MAVEQVDGQDGQALGGCVQQEQDEGLGIGSANAVAGECAVMVHPEVALAALGAVVDEGLLLSVVDLDCLAVLAFAVLGQRELDVEGGNCVLSFIEVLSAFHRIDFTVFSEVLGLHDSWVVQVGFAVAEEGEQRDQSLASDYQVVLHVVQESSVPPINHIGVS